MTRQMPPLTRVVDALPHPNRTVAMLDRLLHRSVVFNIDGDSYRMREHRARTEALSGRRRPRTSGGATT